MALLNKKVLIVGNGYLGSAVVAQFVKDKSVAWEVTVLTPNDFQEVPFRMTKALAVGASEHDKTIYPLQREPGVTYVIDACLSLRRGVCVTAKNGELSFDFAVVATGVNMGVFSPSTNENTIELRRAIVQGMHAQILSANSIVVGGAGPIGVEIAADIKLRHKTKTVTIINPSGKVLELMPKTLADKAAGALAKMGINHLADFAAADAPSNGKLALKSGKELDCDLYIVAFAKGPNSSFMDPACKTPEGYIKVNQKCEIVGLEGSVWAVGDVSSLTQVKGAAIGKDQITLVPANISCIAKGCEQAVWVPSFPFGVVTGPLLVALGHDVEGGYGVGPNLPGCFCSWFCFCCCCAGGPCQAPAGAGVAKMKNDWNNTVFPSVGFGMGDGNKDKKADRPFSSLEMTR